MSLPIADADGVGSLSYLPYRLWDSLQDRDSCMHWNHTNGNCGINAHICAKQCGLWEDLSLFVHLVRMLDMVEHGR